MTCFFCGALALNSRTCVGGVAVSACAECVKTLVEIEETRRKLAEQAETGDE